MGEVSDDRARTLRSILLVLTLMLAGRAMTLAFIGRAGGSAPGDPPAAWLMPLVGDAVIGLSALAVAFLLMRTFNPLAWGAAVLWNVLGIWDALSAYLIHLSAPWPEFFMVQIFGSSMFFAASAMHGICLWILARAAIRQTYGVANPQLVSA